MFDDYLRQRGERTGEHLEPFTAADYDTYVDGKPRADGTRSFLQSRGIELPEGSEDDGPDDETIVGLGARKNQLVLKKIAAGGVQPYPGSVRYLKAAREAGLRCAVVSSSTNCRDVLAAAGIAGDFDAVVDGVVAHEQHLQGKAGARHVPGRGGGAAHRAGPRGGVRGRPGWRGRGPGRQFRLGGRRGPRRAG
jgi:beta-phosphoglucomutase-like phosphatase (HAD superfamily)